MEDLETDSELMQPGRVTYTSVQWIQNYPKFHPPWVCCKSDTKR